MCWTDEIHDDMANLKKTYNDATRNGVVKKSAEKHSSAIGKANQIHYHSMIDDLLCMSLLAS